MNIKSKHFQNKAQRESATIQFLKKIIQAHLLFLVLGFSILYFTVMNLKRVEADNDFVYITNYLKIFKYPYFNVEKITEKNYGLFRK